MSDINGKNGAPLPPPPVQITPQQVNDAIAGAINQLCQTIFAFSGNNSLLAAMIADELHRRMDAIHRGELMKHMGKAGSPIIMPGRQ